MQHDGSSPASRTDRFFEQGEGKGAPPAQFYGAMQTIPAGTQCSSTSISTGVEYTLTDNTGDQPVVATFTPE